MDQKDMNNYLEQALAGDKDALGELLGSVQADVFNLALRMLGTVTDAEDACQEIIIRVMTNLASFRGESAFSTWVFRIALNHLTNYRKGQFAHAAFSWEMYGEDIASGREQGVGDLSQGVDRQLLEQELKYACTNVMLQCFDVESRAVFILGTMFKLDSRTAGEILQMSPEAYRQKLSRLRRKMSEFLSAYCGLGGGSCNCGRRVNYAIATHRLQPKQLDYVSLEVREYTQAMEKMDELSGVFEKLPMYGITDRGRALCESVLRSPASEPLWRGGEAQ